MAGGKHVVVWPHVKVVVNGKRKVLAKGDLVPDDVGAVVREELTSFGAIAGVVEVPADADAGSDRTTVAKTADPAEFDPAVGGNIKDTEAYVGDDKAKAQAMLDLENEQAEPRPTLVKKLEAVLAAGDGSGDGGS